MRIVITGANRGIGLELTRQYLQRGDTVEATARTPENAQELKALGGEAGRRLRIHACDVADDESVHYFVNRLERAPIDLLINNAGVMGKMQSFEGQDLRDVMHTFNVNALGMIRVTRAVLPFLRQGTTRKIASVTSGMGSIGDNTSGGAYGYRMSKAALNMANKSLSIDLGREGFTCLVLNPGWVKTDMGGPNAPTLVHESAEGLIKVIDAATPDKTGTFFNFNGNTYEW